MVAICAVAIMVLWLAYLARWGLMVVYLSGLIAVGISPLAGWIEQRHVPGTNLHPPRWLSALIVYLAGGAIAAGIGSAVVPRLIDQAQELTQHGPSLLEGAEHFLVRHGLIPYQMSVTELVGQIPVDVRQAVFQQFWNVIGGALGLTFILVLSLYLLHEAQTLRAMALSLVPRARQGQARRALDEIASRIGAWMMGQLMLSGIIGSTTALALGLLGIPYFYVLAFIAALGEMVPYAGPVVAAVPGILLALTVSWRMALLVAAFYVAQQQFESQILVPNLMQRQVGLTSSVVIIAVTLGWSVSGALGAVIAVPTAAILHVALVTLREDGATERG